MPHHAQTNTTNTVVIKKSGGIQKPKPTVHSTHHALPNSHSKTFIRAAQLHALTHTPSPVPVTHSQTFIPNVPITARPIIHTQTFVPAAAMPVVHTQIFVPAGQAAPTRPRM